jgi:hypothetical protein
VPARPLTATRRTALAVTTGLTGLVAAGCTAESSDDPTTPSTTSVPPVDADQALVDDVVAALAALHGYVDALAREVPALRPALRPFRRLHAAHLEALDGPVQDRAHDRAATPTAGDPAAAARELVRREQQLQRRLATASVRAESGTLAKLLASMSAAVAQHLVAFG